MSTFSRRALMMGASAAVGWIAAQRLGPSLPSYDGTARITPATGDAILNDASGLSPTPIHRHIIVTEDPGEALITAIRTEMAEARSAGRPFNIGAARHSMGAQAIPENGHAVTFDNGTVELDIANQTYRAHAGARWSQVINTLDPAGFSPAVMQSNNDFGVAATYSVNAHGWPVPYGPMGATVRACRMILPSGDLITASRSENPDLFGHAMGGYGLIGAIVDIDVDMVPNSRLIPTFETMPAEAFAPAFRAAVDDPAVTMAYGRLNVERDSFFTKALLITYRETEDQSDLPEAAGSGAMSHIASRLYRAQLGSETMKSFRWWNETTIGPRLGGGETTRNSLINEPVVTLDDRNDDRTDILHEYFIGFDQFDAFLEVCRAIIPASYQEFLNVTLRFIDTDATSTLTYAPVPRIAAVMSFSQELTQRAEADMARMTWQLIDGIMAIGGTYYLPYRPHATPDQLVAAYPNAPAFAAAKRELDPTLTLRSVFWDRYLDSL